MSQATEILAGYDQRIVELTAQINARAADTGEVDAQAMATLADVQTARAALVPTVETALE